ncbi:alpha/beta fold hydrolase [Acanthopleuribacter pedis]|uniref:Alpha/beta hydrolase n=1 Tax=Acanthopleuribacter pedis TaxID=442870 RepID=A0A8J7Q997_9BACT|nr:alpha/beta hydrolase [Acanthopleuribacter pedis]MBO1320971.1 alpha/beta hydrolase [Acanthopleuribacter pedis]
MQPSQATETWIARAWHTPYQQETVTVTGCPINTLRWGNPDHPGVLLVHGGLAHAQWWRFIAPLLSEHYYVVALDLSGHGDSGHRDSYDAHWLEEIITVRHTAGFNGPPVLVGHSMGGLLSVGVSAFYPDAWRATLIVDSPITGFSDKNDRSDSPRGGPRRRCYDSLEAGVKRFRLLPHQPCESAELMGFIAASSLRRQEEGWTWKFDPHVFETSDRRPTAPLLNHIRCPWWLVRGEQSRVVKPDIEQAVRELGLAAVPVISIPRAHHHLLLDQPLAFITLLRTFLALHQPTAPA